MPRYDFGGTVALITGAGRGQGRSHAVGFAEHGADVAAFGAPRDVPSSPYPLATADDLDETVRQVEATGSEGLALRGDVRDEAAVRAAVEAAVAEFGGVDVLVANAGLYNVADAVAMDERTWAEMVDTNLEGAWLAAKHVGKHFVERGGGTGDGGDDAADGGRIVTVGSTASLVGATGAGHYTASKHGVAGLTKALALELAPHGATANCVCPTGVDTPMIEGIVEARGEAALSTVSDPSGPMNVLDEQLIDPGDVTAAVCWLASDAARRVTGATLPVDAGMTAK